MLSKSKVTIRNKIKNLLAAGKGINNTETLPSSGKTNPNTIDKEKKKHV